MYLTVFAVFIIAWSAITGGVGVYSDGTVYVRESSYFIMAILLVILDLLYEAGRFLSKLLLKQDKEKLSEDRSIQADKSVLAERSQKSFPLQA